MQADVRVGHLPMAAWPTPYVLDSALSPSLLPSGSPLEGCGEPLYFRCVRYYQKVRAVRWGMEGCGSWLTTLFTSMLITYDDVVKISDFGTSKELSDKSTKMSFAGTVAWMAPEVIRNEPVSEKVDIWSFGVVLWELLTGEIPYKDVDSSAIIWGVGSNSLHLPVPSSCPDGFKILLRQCW